MNPQLAEYVKQQLAQGVSKETIYSNLVSTGGWKPADVNGVLALHGANIPTEPQAGGVVPTPPVKYTGFWIRWVATFLDGAITAIPFGILSIIVDLFLNSLGLPKLTMQILGFVISSAMTWAYFCIMTYNYGATLGKMLLGIAVKSEDLQKLTLGRVILRETLGKFISGIILGIGFIMSGFTEKKQGLHDKMASSVVVYKNPGESHRVAMVIGIILAAILPFILIIGILSSVVLASLSTARTQSRDLSDMAHISEIRAKAELYYSANNNSYSFSKSCNSGIFADKNIQQSISALNSDGMICYAEGETYAISAKSNGTKKDICVDSTAYVGNGIAVDDGSLATCQVTSDNNSASSTITTVGSFDNNVQLMGNTIVNSSYTYTLPSGWKVGPSNEKSSEIYNEKTGGDISISVDSLPNSKAEKISDLVLPENMQSVIKIEFPKAVFGNSKLGMLDNREAIITTAKISNTKTGMSPQYISILQYNTLYQSKLYSLTVLSDPKQASVAADFNTILNSFKFK
jgi:uncharacterized RDD family membrane protein YckC